MSLLPASAKSAAKSRMRNYADRPHQLTDLRLAFRPSIPCSQHSGSLFARPCRTNLIGVAHRLQQGFVFPARSHRANLDRDRGYAGDLLKIHSGHFTPKQSNSKLDILTARRATKTLEATTFAACDHAAQVVA